jgi:hypothetical protein
MKRRFNHCWTRAPNRRYEAAVGRKHEQIVVSRQSRATGFMNELRCVTLGLGDLARNNYSPKALGAEFAQDELRRKEWIVEHCRSDDERVIAWLCSCLEAVDAWKHPLRCFLILPQQARNFADWTAVAQQSEAINKQRNEEQTNLRGKPRP